MWREGLYYEDLGGEGGYFIWVVTHITKRYFRGLVPFLILFAGINLFLSIYVCISFPLSTLYSPEVTYLLWNNSMVKITRGRIIVQGSMDRSYLKLCFHMLSWLSSCACWSSHLFEVTFLTVTITVTHLHLPEE